MSSRWWGVSVLRSAVAVVSLLVLIAGCGSTPRAELKTGPGITADTITLGVLTDQTGPFSPTTPSKIKGFELLIDEVNAGGGICGRKLGMTIADHGYDVQRALTGYFDLEPKVLGFLDITGSPMMEAIAPDLLQSRVIAAPTSWSADLLGNPNLMIVGSTYDLDVINGLSRLKKDGLLADGDTIGHIYVPGDYGQGALEGSQFAAQQWRLNLQAREIPETGTELPAMFAQLKNAGAKAVFLSTTPKQTALGVVAAEAMKWDVPIMVNAVGFDPAMLASPAAPAVVKRVKVVAPFAPFGADLPGAKEVSGAFNRKFPGVEATAAVNHGYSVGLSFASVLRKACGNGDMTREGMLRAFRQTDHLDTRSLTGPLRFSQAGRPSSDQSFLVKPDLDAPGKLSLIDGPFTSELAKQKASKPR
ncbi:ABC transporter substrate-binding protein [Pseudonocardiaceae bacterium YIM PH 21723]|nr:ABC transporter substrate-binding protein [Pseudonocardiaceae bacterium YIM PH 21723]